MEGTALDKTEPLGGVEGCALHKQIQPSPGAASVPGWRSRTAGGVEGCALHKQIQPSPGAASVPGWRSRN